ncbi:MAG: CHAT domain-containing protein [Sphingobacteriales bacterium]|nr:CHAT domain-containing protein [Sphingobacteriales bacterium]
MNKFLLSFALMIFIVLCFSQTGPGYNQVTLLKSFNEAEKLFSEAEKLSDAAGENEELQAKADITYEKALTAFTTLLPDIKKAGIDSLQLMANLRAALIAYYIGKTDIAKENYLSAMGIKSQVPSLPDSVFFIPFIYTGGIYYDENQFDSALYYYKNAELISNHYTKTLDQSQRLFNRLGVMYYENGNYRQARNYFEKAIAILTSTGTIDNGLLANFKINIASLLVKLEEYNEAETVYESLLPSGFFPDEINHNLGIISLKQKKYQKAIELFKKVNYSNSNKIIELYYNLGVAWSGLGEKDSSTFYLQQALAENIKWNGQKKNTSYGLILRFEADELAKQKEYKKAIEIYQQTISQFDASFNETDYFKNPNEFGTVFSYINLFNTLTAKADAMAQLFETEQKTELLKGSQEAYRSAFSLADYVEKTYTSDEARLFLNKIKYTVHSRPIDISLRLYELTDEKKYLEDAYVFDQQNKASILSLNVQENELRKENLSSQEILEEEASTKSTITRLLLRLSKAVDSPEVQSLQASIRDYEIKLGKLQEKIREDPNYKNKYFITQIPSVSSLQKKLDAGSALLSYHLSDSELVTIAITANRIEFIKTGIDEDFFKTTDSLKQLLQVVSEENKYSGSFLSAKMYQLLIEPFASKFSKINRLIIIPDDELNYLPFEALQDGYGKYLVEKFSVQYLYSTALWANANPGIENKSAGLWAFAPFASSGYSDTAGISYSPLPASKEETSGLKGNILTDSAAKKDDFILSANKYGIIHLATHASADNEEPLRSFISFYPEKGKPADDSRLYAQEIYNMKLDSTDLIILSACETGTGQLIRGEGLMSLSRAFAYAGCSNIITSLWKAEDKTTAFITQRLHRYLDKGLSKDKALQKAKLDLLKNDQIDPRFKTPNYWAHLIFIGNYEPGREKNNWWWIAAGIIIAAIVYHSIKPKNLPAKGRQVHTS